MKSLTPAERLIVAADFTLKPSERREEIMYKLHNVMTNLSRAGVCIKLNSILRSFGYDLIDVAHAHGLKVFADLKLNDIPETLTADGALLRINRPEFVTVMCGAGVKAMKALKAELPDTEVLGVTLLTTLEKKETDAMFECSPLSAVFRLARLGEAAGLGGLIAAPAEAEMLQQDFGRTMTINTPGVRPAWSIVPGDDQNPDRVMTPAKAIAAGADRIVVGRPITQAENPYDAMMRTIDEIASVAP